MEKTNPLLDSLDQIAQIEILEDVKNADKRALDTFKDAYVEVMEGVVKAVNGLKGEAAAGTTFFEAAMLMYLCPEESGEHEPDVWVFLAAIAYYAKLNNTLV